MSPIQNTKTNSTHTPTPTLTTEPSITPSPTQLSPLSGKLFFDMNASGIKDEAAFLLEFVDLKALFENQSDYPLRPELKNEIIKTYQLNPDSQRVMIINEPVLFEGISVCIETNCIPVNEDGTFTFQNIGLPGEEINLTIEDINNENYVLSLRYLNTWHGVKLIEEFQSEEIIVPEQILNRTRNVNLTQHFSISVEIGAENEIGLSQGILTLPYSLKDSENFIFENYIDLAPELNVVRNYKGNTNLIINPHLETNGTTDNHPGVDIRANKDNFIIAASNGTMFLANEVVLDYRILPNRNILCRNGHINKSFVSSQDEILRGQIIGTIGSTNTNHPHNHFGLLDLKNTDTEGWPAVIDPFADLEYTENEILTYQQIKYEHILLTGSIGYWTVNNLPVFPITEY